MKKVGGQNGYIALMATIIISLILLVMTVEQASTGWYVRFNILGTEAKEQSNSLAESCIEQAMAKLLTDPTFAGNSTTTFPNGTCYTLPIELNSPTNGLLTIRTQAVVRNSYTNLKVTASMDNVTFENTGLISPTQNNPGLGGDGNGFEINPDNAHTDGVPGIPGSAQNIDGSGDSHLYSGYNFNIPPNSTITGIQVRLDWWINSVNGTNNIEVDLSWDGGTNWTELKTTVGESTSVSNTSILGGPSDTWSRTWNTNEFSPTNFIVKVKTNSSVSSRDFYLDWVPVKINYINNISKVTSGNFYITPIESWEETTNHP